MSTTFRQIRHVETGQLLVARARWCDTFASRLRGFTFKRTLLAGEGLVLVEKKESRVNTAIHMLFVFFPLGVIWVNDKNEVVDTIVARPWRLSYAPRAPARYVIESRPDVVDMVRSGDHIQFETEKGEER
jgi:uncharacterized membrane protein (UPF0127 family)